tara:strand:- start:149 stop:310 length:162 start_codon:yes stop_codon:yes gene_type:complete
MNHYHIAYFIPSATPKLTGITIEGKNMMEAYNRFLFEMDYKVKEELIKYIIQL